MPYVDPVINKYFDLIKAANPNIKAYFQAEPFKIPASKLPAVFIVKTQTEVSPHTNAEDEHQIGLRLVLVTDIRKELSDEKDVVPGIAQLYDIMEGRVAATYKLKDTSLLNILRTNITVDASLNVRTDLATITRADYGQTYNNREQEWFIESHIDFLCNYTQAR